MQPLTDEARHDRNGARVASEARAFGAEERRELASRSQRHLAESGVGRLVPERVAEMFGERARVRLVSRERRGTKQEIRIQKRGAHQCSRRVLGGDAGRLELGHERRPTDELGVTERPPKETLEGRAVTRFDAGRGARRCTCRELRGDDERCEVFAREQVRMDRIR